MLFSYRIKILVPCSENIVPVTIICNTDLEKMFPGIPSINERPLKNRFRRFLSQYQGNVLLHETPVHYLNSYKVLW